MIRVGTCGWSYADWKGPFYPAGMKAADMLPYYAERFPIVELDATYYRVLPRSSFDGMDRKTPDGFQFAVKLPGSATHAPEELQDAVHPDVAELRSNIEPLVAGGKLACFLMQFPNSFKPSPQTAGYVERLRYALEGMPLVAEFRNRDWQSNETLQMLRSLHIGLCNVDGPRFKSLPRPSSDVTSDIAYVRFHGRNYQTWWKGDATTRYDYLYPAEELAEWVPRIHEAAVEAKETLVLFNNHRNGQATVNAKQMKQLLEA